MATIAKELPTGTLYDETREEIRTGKVRVQDADARLSFATVSVVLLLSLVANLWLVYNWRASVEQVRREQVLSTVGEDGRVSLAKLTPATAVPDEVEIRRTAHDVIELVQGAGTNDFLTRFKYAERLFLSAALEEFRELDGSDAIRTELAKAKAEGKEFWREVMIPAEGVRALTEEDLAGSGWPRRLEPQELRPPYDVYVEGHVKTFRTDPQGQRVQIGEAKPFAWWVRLALLERRTMQFPNGLAIEYRQPLRARGAVGKE